jgi:hypothetical protein
MFEPKLHPLEKPLFPEFFTNVYFGYFFDVEMTIIRILSTTMSSIDIL